MEETCIKYRAYLQQSGVMEAISDTLLELFQLGKENRPPNPTEFLRQNLAPAQTDSIASLTAELQELYNEIEKLRKIIPADMLPQRPEQSEAGETIADGTESVVTESVITESVFSETTDATEMSEMTAMTEATGATELTAITEESAEIAESAVAESIADSNKSDGEREIKEKYLK